MEIKRSAMAGTLESSDVLVRVEPNKELILEIESPVFAQYGEEIERSCREVLAEMKIVGARVVIEDHGALDCTIRARCRTALARAASF